MYEDQLTQLLAQCESPIERELLNQLYPQLSTSRARELRAQYKIDDYDDMPLTIPDFAFPDMRIAIYCDGFTLRKDDREKFRRDRSQSRELQLRGWIVLRFTGSEINRDSEMVIDTIERAIDRRNRQRAWRNQQEPTPPVRPQKTPTPQARQPGRSQQQQKTPVRQEEKSWQESMQEWRNEKEQALPVRQPEQDHQRPQRPRTQQKTEGGMCGVVVLACVIVGILVLLDFIF